MAVMFPQLPLYVIAIICGILSFLVTRLSMPKIIKKLEKANIVGKDIHKSWKPIVAEMGGFGILFGFIIGIFAGIGMHSILTFPLCIVLIVILLVGIIGIADDLLVLSSKEKLFLLFLAGIPLIWAAPPEVGILYLIAIPIDNKILYIEPIYQQYINEEDSVPTLKRVIAASGNKVAIGNTLEEALTNLVSQYAVDIEVENTDNIDDLIDAIIRANDNLKDSSQNGDWTMMGKDMDKLQTLIDQLNELVKEQKQEEQENGENNTINDLDNNLYNGISVDGINSIIEGSNIIE